jgi:glycosyltransferase involved in cell wall biosynthesis
MAKLVILLRVKDGIFFAQDWLNCYEKIADEIVVLDNGSTDGTYEILKAHPKVVDIAQTQGYNEGRDKNMLYALARKRNPDWCLWVDIDEIFEPELTRRHFDKLMDRNWVNKYAFRRFHFIDKEHFAGSWYRLNYSSGHDRIMWRESPKGYFENLIIDSPNVKGINGITLYTNYRLKHTGYISKEIVDKKADIYRAIVPEKEGTFQKMYMKNERPIKWIDNRNHIKVIMLNALLSGIQFINIFRKAYRKGIKLAGSFLGSNTQPKDLNATV